MQNAINKAYHCGPRIASATQRLYQRRWTTGQKSDEPLFLSGPFAWYSRKLDTHPLLTKAISCGFITQSGDLLSQFIQCTKSKDTMFQWDMPRTARMGLLGFALVAPIVHYWYGGLARVFPGSSAAVVAKRVLWDQALFSPLFLPTWLTSLWILEGQTSGDIFHMLKAEVPTALVANWALWVPSQIINFRFVPTKFQVLFSNFVALGWNAYLSFTAHEAEAKVERSRQVELDVKV
jgi:hypothetical protein